MLIDCFYRPHNVLVSVFTFFQGLS